MAGLKGFVFAAFLSASLLAAGATAAHAEPDHGKFHRKQQKQHEKFHRRQAGPPYGAAQGYHRHSPTCGHDVGRQPTYGRPTYGGPTYGGPTYGHYDAECGHILAKAQKARDGLARWEGTGRHRDAVRAWHEVLQKTPQRLAECRRKAQYREARRYDQYDQYDRYDRYDPYYDPYGDPYASSGYGDSFEWKRDWPFLLGGLLGQYSNR